MGKYVEQNCGNLSIIINRVGEYGENVNLRSPVIDSSPIRSNPVT
jgi:hypothetical protein